jgi:hypothetical protein
VNPDAAAEGRRDNDQYEARADDQKDKIAAPGQYRPRAADDENDGVGRRTGPQYNVAGRPAREYDEKEVGQRRFGLPPRDPHDVAEGRAQEGFVGLQGAPYHEDKSSGRRCYDDLKGQAGGKLLQAGPQDEMAPGPGDEIDAAAKRKKK